MKRRLISFVSALVLACSVILTSQLDVNAEAAEAQKAKLVDGSYLTMNESSTGVSQSNSHLRGQFLMDGQSSITRAGSGRIYAYGATTANTTVEYVAVIVYVDRYDEDLDVWMQVDAWVEDDIDTYFVATSKTLRVDKGYSYRVHCEHFAGNEADYPYDSANSVTDGIWID